MIGIFDSEAVAEEFILMIRTLSRDEVATGFSILEKVGAGH